MSDGLSVQADGSDVSADEPGFLKQPFDRLGIGISQQHAGPPHAFDFIGAARREREYFRPQRLRIGMIHMAERHHPLSFEVSRDRIDAIGAGAGHQTEIGFGGWHRAGFRLQATGYRFLVGGCRWWVHPVPLAMRPRSPPVTGQPTSVDCNP
jgi:hypothetical protein